MYSTKVKDGVNFLNLFLMLGLQLISAGFAAFIQYPMSVHVQPESGSIAVFFCQHETAQIITWQVNEITLSNIDASNITACTSSIPNGPPLHIVKIPSEREYNNTEVVCLALFLNGSQTERTVTPAVYLTLQDDLEPFPNDFLETPASLNLSIGEEAIFSCQHCIASRINWRFNGTLIYGSNMPNGVTINYNNTINSYCGTFTLTIMASTVENFNHTYIQCEAEVDDSLNVTLPALLLVQGPLASVTDLRRIFESQNTLDYSWSQPHFLDVTNTVATNPDIIYCVHIYSFPCLAHAKSTSDLDTIDKYNACNVTEPSITIDKQLGRDLLHGIEVIPRINLDVAPNGTRNIYQEEFIYFNDTDITYKFDISSMSDMILIQVVLNLESISSSSLIQPRNISLKFMIIDPQAPWMESVKDTCLTSLNQELSDNMVSYLNILNCSFLLIDMLYVGTLVVASTGCQISSPFDFSTHLIQDVTVALTSQPSEISVCCTFVTTSRKPTPSGFLVVAYSTSESIPRLHYGIATRSSKDALNAEVTIPRLYEYEYRVSVFALNEDGLPSNRSVAIARTISNVTNREDSLTLRSSMLNETEGHNSTLIVEASQNLSGSCINVKCTFMDESASSCVFIVTNKSQASSEYGILYIDVFAFERPENGNTTGGCIRTMNITESYIDVLSISEEMRLTETIVVNISKDTDPGSPNPPTDTSTDINLGVIIPTAFICCVTLVLTLILSILYTYKSVKSNKVEPDPQ